MRLHGTARGLVVRDTATRRQPTMSCGSPSASNAGRRAAISYSTQPSDHMSLAYVYGRAAMTSGDLRGGTQS